MMLSQPVRDQTSNGLTTRIKDKLTRMAYASTRRYHYWNHCESATIEDLPEPDQYVETITRFVNNGFVKKTENIYPLDLDMDKPKDKMATFKAPYNFFGKSANLGYRSVRSVYMLLLLPFTYIIAMSLIESNLLTHLSGSVSSTLGITTIPSLSDIITAPLGVVLLVLALGISLLRFINWSVRYIHKFAFWIARFFATPPTVFTVWALKFMHNQYIKVKIRLAKHTYEQRWNAAMESPTEAHRF